MAGKGKTNSATEIEVTAMAKDASSIFFQRWLARKITILLIGLPGIESRQVASPRPTSMQNPSGSVGTKKASLSRVFGAVSFKKQPTHHPSYHPPMLGSSPI